MSVEDDVYYFNIGGREVYFYRNEDTKRNVFGLKTGDTVVESNFAMDALFENSPEQYLASVFAFLEGHENVLRGEGL